mgnify:CR=1 FL=1
MNGTLGLAMLVGHLVGDYWVQNGWMAANKGKQVLPLLVHCSLYTAGCFLIMGAAGWWMPPLASGLVFVTHAALDGTGLVKEAWAMFNNDRAENCPLWLRIVMDNTIHLGTLLAAALLWYRP